MGNPLDSTEEIILSCSVNDQKSFAKMSLDSSWFVISFILTESWWCFWSIGDMSANSIISWSIFYLFFFFKFSLELMFKFKNTLEDPLGTFCMKYLEYFSSRNGESSRGDLIFHEQKLSWSTNIFFSRHDIS